MIDATRRFELPPQVTRHDGRPRLVGFELEFSCITLEDTAEAVQTALGGSVRSRTSAEQVIAVESLGDFTIEQAADYLAETVPMDHETALEEAAFFAFNPGQAISYQVGKLQILAFLADARARLGEDFSLRGFHDFLMVNGNVPIALQRWEYLGDDSDVLHLDALGGKPVTVPR